MIIAIPCYNRPAHLAALLRTIERARLADQQRYLFCADDGAPSAIYEVIGSFALQKQVIAVIQLGKHGQPRPAYNILNAWRIALGFLANERSVGSNHDSLDDEPIGLLEDDLLVSDGIFEFWHDALNVAPEAVGVSACRNQNLAEDQLINRLRAMWPSPRVQQTSTGTVEVANEPFIYLDDTYQSLAVAMKASIVKAVLASANVDYFANQAKYVTEYLPTPELPATACSQDALFDRLVRRYHLPMVYPVIPRACHVGWYGINRRNGVPLRADLPWQEGAQRILEMSAEDMNKYADPHFRDITRCDLSFPRVPLKLV